jgi:methionyl-tRNA formyltransferase
MKIIFAGTPVFAAHALEALLKAGHEIAMVLTQPDRPAGRGMQITSSSVKRLAQQHELPLLQPHSLKQSEIDAQLTSINADVMVVAAYGLILPKPILNIPRLGCLNIHASLLPRWRGAAPIQRSILAGDCETGITIMQMDQGLDTGPMLLQRSIPIASDDTSQTLHDKLSLLGGGCIVEALSLLQQGKLPATAQDETTASYASKLTKSESKIDWQLDAEQINRAVRAFNPHPGAHSCIHATPLKIWQAKVEVSSPGNPGEVISTEREGIKVVCGKNSLILKVVQKSGGKKMNAGEFLTGSRLRPGDRFEYQDD